MPWRPTGGSWIVVGCYELTTSYGAPSGKMQLAPDLSGQLFRRVRYVQNHSVQRFFEVGELPGEDGFAGKVAAARRDVLAHDVVGSLKVDDAKVETGRKQLAIRLLQSRTGQNHIASGLTEAQQFRVHSFQPRPTIDVRKRNALPHFFDVRRRVQIIG